MDVTLEDRKHLRSLLNEQWHDTEKTADDTRFSEVEIGRLLSNAKNIYWAASEGWMQKAGRYQEEMQDVRRTESGTETYEATRLLDRIRYAEHMSEYYASLGEKGGTATNRTSALLLGARRYKL